MKNNRKQIRGGFDRKDGLKTHHEKAEGNEVRDKKLYGMHLNLRQSIIRAIRIIV